MRLYVQHIVIILVEQKDSYDYSRIDAEVVHMKKCMYVKQYGNKYNYQQSCM